jgi:hypothetical protein
MDARDRRLMPLVRRFSAHDLYPKGGERPCGSEQRPQYEDLVARFLPDPLQG